VELISQGRYRLALSTAVALSLVFGCRRVAEPDGRTAASEIDSIPSRERFIPNDGLRVSIRLSQSVVRVGETTTITARFENIGTSVLLLNPHLIGGARLDETRTLPGCSSNADYIYRTITRADFVNLPPSASWETELSPRFSTERRAAARIALALPPGKHRIAFRYSNYPDCLFTRYDPYLIDARVWEGQIDAVPVTLTVTSLEPADERAVIDRLEEGSASDEDISVMTLQDTQTALVAVLKYFAIHPTHRSRVLNALRASPHPDVARRVLEEVRKLDSREHELDWTLLAILVRERGRCDSWSALVALLEASSPGRTYDFGEAVSTLASQCPEVAEQLRATVRNARLPERSRGDAAAFLGWLGSKADAPLLIELLREPGLSPATREAAVTALGRVGGDEARAALLAALEDTTYRSIRSVVVAALAREGGSDVESALVGHLDSRDPYVVMRILSALGQLKAHSAVRDVVRLLKHPNPAVRLYAAGFLEGNADGGIVPEMRLAVADRDDGVRARALFYLARHADTASLETFERYAGSTKQGDREGAIAGLRRVGTADSVRAIRPLLDSKDASVRSYTTLAIEELTFRTWRPPHRFEPVAPAGFDAWLGQQRDRTRRDWALDALGREPGPDVVSQQSRLVEKQRAIDYLDGLRNRSLLPVFERSAGSENYAVRIRAADAIAVFDKPRARRLLVRELESRFLGACSASHRSLERLTGRSFALECERPRERIAAKAAWSAILTGLESDLIRAN